MKRMHQLTTFIFVVTTSQLFADELDIPLKAPDGWKGERISLPPGFAPDMKLKGIEEIRFAPGMFDAKSDSFFSYIFAFQLEPKPELTKETLHREFLTYYRGLAVTVLKDRDVPVDPKKFTLDLKLKKQSKDAPLPKGVTAYTGELKWLEPFVTRKDQTLHLELESWMDGKSKQSYLLVMVSPQKKTAKIWKDLRKIRQTFHSNR